MIQTQSWMIAHFVMIGFHSPKTFPSFDNYMGNSSETEKPKEQVKKVDNRTLEERQADYWKYKRIQHNFDIKENERIRKEALEKLETRKQNG